MTLTTWSRSTIQSPLYRLGCGPTFAGDWGPDQRVHPPGSTLQLGIGGVPDAVLGAITDARDLRIWSETISDGVLALERAGHWTQTFRFGRVS